MNSTKRGDMHDSCAFAAGEQDAAHAMNHCGVVVVESGRWLLLPLPRPLHSHEYRA